jgi:hypothetical protein
MRSRFLPIIVLLLAGQRMALAQPAETYPAPSVETASVASAGVHASAEYLLCWVKNGDVPPLERFDRTFCNLFG